MPSKATNEARRVETAGLMEDILSWGWTRGEVALVMGVTPSAVSSWATGRSMATNRDRTRLSHFPAREHARARELLETTRARLRGFLDSERAGLAATLATQARTPSADLRDAELRSRNVQRTKRKIATYEKDLSKLEELLR